jgi:hypothetical protein
MVSGNKRQPPVNKSSISHHNPHPIIAHGSALLMANPMANPPNNKLSQRVILEESGDIVLSTGLLVAGGEMADNGATATFAVFNENMD